MINFKTYASLYGEAKSYDSIDMFIMERGWQDWMDHVNKNDVAKILTDIYEMSKDNINGILQVSGLNLSSLARKFYVPLITAQKWKAGQRKPPEYTMIMLSYITLIDKYFADMEDVSNGDI